MGSLRHRWRARAARGFFALLVASALSAPRETSADSLTPVEIDRLGRGETVVRPSMLHVDGRRYVGGVTYTVLEATPDDLLALVEDEASYLEVLPRAKFAQRIRSRDPHILVEMHHGNALIDAAYTLRLEKDPADTRIRFWIDPTRPHDVEDAWGYFRYANLPSSSAGAPRLLLTYGVLADLGAGALRSLYEDRVKAAMLTVPQRLRKYIHKRLGRESAEGGA